MKNISINPRLILVAGLIFVAALSRLIPHPGNFTAVGAMAIFGAATLPKRWSFILPIIALWLSDVLLNNIIYREYYPELTLLPSTLLVTYLPMLLVWGLSALVLKNLKPSFIASTSVAGSFIFFLVSNFFVWFGAAHVYGPTFSGLMLCYTAGLPFLANQIVGDLLFSGLIFGIYALAQKQFKVLQTV
jgi:hypothetical protein